MRRIIIHHTGGTYKANNVDKKAYHYIIEGDGTIVKGDYLVHDNEDCTDGKYAAHTYKGNTGSIGIAVACNYGYTISNPRACKFPLTFKQYQTLIKFTKRLMKQYGIGLGDVWTHYEFDRIRHISQGKSDITFLPHLSSLKPYEILNQIKLDIKFCKD